MDEATAIPVEFLFTLRLEGAANPEHCFSTPWGERQAMRLDTGSFAGPRISGTIASGLANDWGAVSATGTRALDAELVLQAEDGEALFMTFRGREVPGEPIRIAAIFEASNGPHAWLTEILAMGLGRREAGDLVFDIHAIR